MMSVLTRDHRFEEVANASVEGDEVKNMCDVLDRVEKQGEIRGEKRGEKKGEMKKAKEVAVNLKAQGFSNQDISDLIAVDIETIESWFPNELVMA